MVRGSFELNHQKPFRLCLADGSRPSSAVVSDALGDGQRFRLLCILYDRTFKVLATVMDHSLSGARMTRALDEIVRRCGQREKTVRDNRAQITPHAVPRWCLDLVFADTK